MCSWVAGTAWGLALSSACLSSCYPASLFALHPCFSQNVQASIQGIPLACSISRAVCLLYHYLQ